MAWPKTLGDDLDLALQYVWSKVKTKIRPSMSVRAPCCGRRTSADAVLDVRHIPELDADWLCDGCRTLLTRDPEGEWPFSRLAELCNFPEQALETIRAKELVARWDRQAARKDRIFRPVQAFEAARIEVNHNSWRHDRPLPPIPPHVAFPRSEPPPLE